MQITDLHIRRVFQILTGIMVLVTAVISINFFIKDKPFASTLTDKIQLPAQEMRKKYKRPTPPAAAGGAANSNTSVDIKGGDEFFEAGVLEKALEAYRTAAENDPKNAMIYERIGDVLFTQKQFPLAEQSYEIAYLINATNAELALKYTKSLLAQRKIAEANRIIDSINPTTPESMLYQGMLAAFLNQSEQSKTVLQDVLATNDQKAKINAQLILDAYGEFEITTDGKPAHLQALLSKAFNALEEYELSIALGLEAIKTEPNYRDIWIILGHSYLNQEHWADAETALLKGISLDTSHPLAYALLGFAHEGLGKRREAIEDFQKALKLGYKPTIQIQQKLAENLFLTQQYEKALLLYETVIDQSKETIDIHFFIRPIFIAINHLRDSQKALSLAEKAFSEHPQDPMAYNLIGWAYDALGNDFLAEFNLLEALKRDPRLAAAHLNLGRLYEKQGKVDQAKEFYQHAYTFAEESGDTSIGNLAATLYNNLRD